MSFARVSTLQVSADRLGDLTEFFKDDVIERFRGKHDFQGATLLADRSSGKSIALTYWGSEDGLRASEEEANEARRDANERGGGTAEPQVERYEILLDEDLR
jgi:hypothetical protein